jgi:predicted nucleic acid-binding protein
LRLYLDASALVKRYVDEAGSDAVVEAMTQARICSICRIGYVETIRAVARGGDPDDVSRAERDWRGFHVVEVDREVVERAAELSVETGLRTLDALHLAAALSLPDAEVVLATWDCQLHRAAQEYGIRTLPLALD